MYACDAYERRGGDSYGRIFVSLYRVVVDPGSLVAQEAHSTLLFRWKETPGSRREQLEPRDAPGWGAVGHISIRGRWTARGTKQPTLTPARVRRVVRRPQSTCCSTHMRPIYTYSSVYATFLPNSLTFLYPEFLHTQHTVKLDFSATILLTKINGL